MSITIIKAGVLDTIQDGGRNGYRCLGIGAGGAMDVFSASLAHALLGNSPGVVIEMHFPAATIMFNAQAIIVITGANFLPVANGVPVCLNQPLAVDQGTKLSFKKPVNGARCYLAIQNGLQLTAWLQSFSTNLFAGAGGLGGRKLRDGDVLAFKEKLHLKNLKGQPFKKLPWFVSTIPNAAPSVCVLKGADWPQLTTKSKQAFTEEFTLSPSADRMGYRLQGPCLQIDSDEKVSSAVNFGTVQLLPSGDLIILMADHQTTGGYPIIANIISAHLGIVAQLQPGNKLRFKMVDIEQAETQLWHQYIYLKQVKQAACLQIDKWI